jgi:hypothetical protein
LHADEEIAVGHPLDVGERGFGGGERFGGALDSEEPADAGVEVPEAVVRPSFLQLVRKRRGTVEGFMSAFSGLKLKCVHCDSVTNAEFGTSSTAALIERYGEFGFRAVTLTERNQDVSKIRSGDDFERCRACTYRSIKGRSRYAFCTFKLRLKCRHSRLFPEELDLQCGVAEPAKQVGCDLEVELCACKCASLSLHFCKREAILDG